MTIFANRCCLGLLSALKCPGLLGPLQTLVGSSWGTNSISTSAHQQQQNSSSGWPPPSDGDKTTPEPSTRPTRTQQHSHQDHNASSAAGNGSKWPKHSNWPIAGSSIGVSQYAKQQHGSADSSVVAVASKAGGQHSNKGRPGQSNAMQSHT